MKKILVPFDFSETSKYGAAFAVELAEKFDAEIIFLYCLHFDDFAAHPQQKDADIKTTVAGVNQFAHDNLSKFAAGLKTKAKTETRISSFHLQEAITKIIREDKIDLVIMGTKGSSGLSEWLIGSNTERVVRRAECPVISVPSLVSHEAIKKILVPIDLNELQEEILTQLAKLQQFFSAEMEFIWINFGYAVDKELIQKSFRNLLSKYGFENAEIAIEDPTAGLDSIHDIAMKKEVDMISMATHSRRGIAHWFAGSFTEDTINRIKLPVWTFKLDKKNKHLELPELKGISKEANKAERKFKNGDLVTLKSGGPQMTVDKYVWKGNYKSQNIIDCIWFEGEKRLTAEFDQESVQLVTD